MRHLWHAVDEKRVTAAAPTFLFNAANFMLVWGEAEAPVLCEPDEQADGDGEDGDVEDALDYVRPVVVVSPVLGGKRTAIGVVEQVRFGGMACAPVLLGQRQDVAVLKIYDDSLQFFFAS